MYNKLSIQCCIYIRATYVHMNCYSMLIVRTLIHSNILISLHTHAQTQALRICLSRSAPCYRCICFDSSVYCKCVNSFNPNTFMQCLERTKRINLGAFRKTTITSLGIQYRPLRHCSIYASDVNVIDVIPIQFICQRFNAFLQSCWLALIGLFGIYSVSVRFFTVSFSQFFWSIGNINEMSISYCGNFSLKRNKTQVWTISRPLCRFKFVM